METCCIGSISVHTSLGIVMLLHVIHNRFKRLKHGVLQGQHSCHTCSICSLLNTTQPPGSAYICPTTGNATTTVLPVAGYAASALSTMFALAYLDELPLGVPSESL